MQNTLDVGKTTVLGGTAGGYFVTRYLIMSHIYDYLAIWFKYIVASNTTITVELYDSTDTLLESSTFALTTAASFTSSGIQNISLASITSSGIYYFKIKSSVAIQVQNFCAITSDTGVS